MMVTATDEPFDFRDRRSFWDRAAATADLERRLPDDERHVRRERESSLDRALRGL